MYERFFSLDASPFVLTPDPRFLFRSRGHHDILTSLLYGIASQKGIMALIGDVGTGKTTLCRALLQELPKDVQSALILNPHLSDTELLGAILDDLGLERRGATRAELMLVLVEHLLAAGAAGRTVVVILDEAQQMSIEALEQIRILSNLETPSRKLLQIVLAGQSELADRLRRRELRQLDQRIGIRCRLQPLSRNETFRYIEHRLRAAGLAGSMPFTRAAIARIYSRSRGTPRVVNLVCDRALLAAYSTGARVIDDRLVRLAIRNLWGRNPVTLRARVWRRPVAVAAAGRYHGRCRRGNRPLAVRAESGVARLARRSGRDGGRPRDGFGNRCSDRAGAAADRFRDSRSRHVKSCAVRGGFFGGIVAWRTDSPVGHPRRCHNRDGDVVKIEWTA